MAFLLFRVAVGAEGFALDLDRSGSLGPLGSLGSGIFFNGSGGGRGRGRGPAARRGGGGEAGAGGGAGSPAGGAFLSAAFLAGFTVFALAAVFGADLTVLILGASTEAASAAGFFSAAAAFLVVEAVFLAAVLRAAVFLAADASGAPVSNGFFAIKFQVKERIMNQFRRLSRFITEPHPEGPANLSKAPCTFPNQRGGRPPPSH